MDRSERKKTGKICKESKRRIGCGGAADMRNELGMREGNFRTRTCPSLRGTTPVTRILDFFKTIY